MAPCGPARYKAARPFAGRINRSLRDRPALSASRAFVIHLERATGRRPTAEALLRALPIPGEIFPAVDGRALAADAVKAAYARGRYAPRYPFALVPAEIGAFLSHRAVWRRIVEDGLDHAVVFEDDAAVDPERFEALLAFLAAERRRWSYVLMPAAGLEPSGEPLAQRDGMTLLRPHTPPLRAIGQVVSREAAARLLALTAPFDRPIDTFLQMNWVTGLTLLAVTPTPIRDVSRETGGTTVQRKRLGFFERLRHEAMRPIYRAQVRARYRSALAADTKP